MPEILIVICSMVGASFLYIFIFQTVKLFQKEPPLERGKIQMSFQRVAMIIDDWYINGKGPNNLKLERKYFTEKVEAQIFEMLRRNRIKWTSSSSELTLYRPIYDASI